MCFGHMILRIEICAHVGHPEKCATQIIMITVTSCDKFIWHDDIPYTPIIWLLYQRTHVTLTNGICTHVTLKNVLRKFLRSRSCRHFAKNESSILQTRTGTIAGGFQYLSPMLHYIMDIFFFFLVR